MLLAITVGLLSFSLTVSLFFILRRWDCTYGESDLQFQGPLNMQKDFLLDLPRGSGIKLCLSSVASLAAATKQSSNVYAQLGSFPLTSYKCYPPDGWLNGGVVALKARPEADVDFEGIGAPLCSPELYQVSNFNISAPASNTITGADAITASADFDKLVCQWIDDSTSQLLELKATYRSTVKMCASIATALGTALAYAAYIEMLLTVTMVLVFSKMGILKSNGQLSLFSVAGGTQALIGGTELAARDSGADNKLNSAL